MNSGPADNTDKHPDMIDPFGSSPHDHQQCQHRALVAAQQLCSNRGVRLTLLRRQVLELIWNSHTPVKAYHLLELLKQKHPNAAPTTVYRALSFLLDHELIHRLQSLNAFIGCGLPGTAHHGQFLICRVCGAAAELPDTDLRERIGRRADELGFRIEIETVEISGTCANCQQAAITSD